MIEKSESNPIPNNAKMILVGGGTLTNTARPLIERGLDISGQAKPNVLVVPTAKYKEAAFNKLITTSRQLFEHDLGIGYDYLHDYNSIPNTKLMQEKINNADFLYLSGGDTKHAIDVWKKYGIDKMLSDAMKNGKVMTGISAGAVAWFDEGYSDSQKYEVGDGEKWVFEPTEGLGHINTIVNPHHNSKDTPDGRIRSEHFREYLADSSRLNGFERYGLGIDNNAALVAINGLIKVVTSKTDSGLHIVSKNKDIYLDAPKYSSDKSADLIDDDGISWNEFYSQLSAGK